MDTLYPFEGIEAILACCGIGVINALNGILTISLSYLLCLSDILNQVLTSLYLCSIVSTLVCDFVVVEILCLINLGSKILSRKIPSVKIRSMLQSIRQNTMLQFCNSRVVGSTQVHLRALNLLRQEIVSFIVLALSVQEVDALLKSLHVLDVRSHELASESHRSSKLGRSNCDACVVDEGSCTCCLRNLLSQLSTSVNHLLGGNLYIQSILNRTDILNNGIAVLRLGWLSILYIVNEFQVFS